MNLPCHFGGDYVDGEIAPVLRDIIPQGAGRRHWIRMLGLERDPAQAIDARLLAEGCIAPIGNLRIREAAEAFEESLETQSVQWFSRDDISTRAEGVIDYAQGLGLAIGGGTGAGGDAPKLLLVENRKGQFAFEGTVPETEIHRHWLVKFPRGRKTADDIAVLQGEAAIYAALEALDFNTIRDSSLWETESRHALWLPRFDREVTHHGILRHGVESIYSLVGRIGDGAALDHEQVFDRMKTCVTQPADPDQLLADYLIRDVLNTAIANRDNHGRNTALIKLEKDIALAPAFDLAPMALDPEGIARTTVWPRELRASNGMDPNYPKVINTLADMPERAAGLFRDELRKLAPLREELVRQGAPAPMMALPALQVDVIGQVIAEMDRMLGTGE
ncbi:HipA domain-containing protein [Marinobacter sp. LN3S78]|uniref:HipA domain-containing protein n=1 Tax=Marinobacter sp. LN3S78 TaxID=3382300 RepID=UPI00387B462C